MKETQLTIQAWTLLLWSFLYYFSVSESVWASKEHVGVFDDPPREYTIHSTTCEGLKKQITAIKSWVEKFGDTLPVQESDYHMGENAITRIPQCEVNILPHLPEYLRTVIGQSPACNGPNCFNSVLVTSKMIPHFRYTTESELSFWLHSKFCKERASDESLQPGDIMAIREKNAEGDWNEYHAFVYLTPELSFSKNGYNQANAHHFQSTHHVMNAYGVKKECWSHQPNPKKTAKDKKPLSCDKIVQAYDCQRPPEGQEELLPQLKNSKKDFSFVAHPKEAMKTGHFVCDLECRIRKMTWNRDILYRTDEMVETHRFVKEHIDPLDTLVQSALYEIELEKKRIKGNWFQRLFASSDHQQEKLEPLEKHEHYWTSLKHRLEGIRHQWGDLNKYLR